MVRAEHIIKTLDLAKRSVVNASGDDSPRKWLEANLDSYGKERYRLSLHVLEGSPARGLVVVNHHDGWAKAFGIDGRLLHTYKVR